MQKSTSTAKRNTRFSTITSVKTHKETKNGARLVNKISVGMVTLLDLPRTTGTFWIERSENGANRSALKMIFQKVALQTPCAFVHDIRSRQVKRYRQKQYVSTPQEYHTPIQDSL